jgi:hypothetical protein
MTEPVDPSDPYGDPFAEDIHDPVVFALNGTDLLYERAQTARQRFEALLASDPAKNVLAISSRQRIKEPLAKLAVTSLSARMHAGRLRGLADHELDQAIIEWNGAYAEALRDLAEVERLGAFAATPDATSDPIPELPLPQVQDWTTVSALVQGDVASWAARVRGKKGQMLIAKPSPGVGKTFAMVRTALHEQAQRQRVVMAVRTKEMLVSELEPRIRKAGYGTVRLHVIQGRDESTCWNFDNVRAVQEHGYAPGSTVCSRCEYHPDIAKQLRSYTVCPYYRSRQNAQNDTASARFGANDYPIIATTHSGYLTAVESGGGRFGKFWPCDMLMFDEDPTDAFEPEVVVKAEHLMLPTPPKPEDRAAHAMATLLSGAIAQAEVERKAMESRGWVMASGIPSPIHSRHGSAYAGNSLHALLDRVATGPLGQQQGFKSAIQVLRDVSDSHVHPAAGSLHGATTAAAVSLVVPPRGLSQIGEALFEENALRMDLRRAAHRKIHGKEMPPTMTSAQVDAALAESEEFDPAYRVRLEFAKDEWRFVFQDFVDMLDQNTNSLYGDAYANIEHTRQIFDKPATDASNPSYVDPVTVINHVAKFPDGSTIVRERTRANITYLLNEGWGDHAARLAVILRTHAGLSVLIYGHGVLKPRVEKLFADNQNFGVAKWAFENWGRAAEAKISTETGTQSSPSQTTCRTSGGMLHKVNARAARDTARLLARNKIDEALVEGTRISLDMNKSDVAHKMADPTTHWRIRQEHDRQNVSELAQALHRVRGLRSPKRMTVVGDGVPLHERHHRRLGCRELSRRTGRPSETEERVRGWVPYGGRGLHRHLSGGRAFGCWSPIFLHALLAWESALFSYSSIYPGGA